MPGLLCYPSSRLFTVARLPGGVESNERIVPVAWFSGPSVDAMPWQPPRMNYQNANAADSEKDEHPGATCPRRDANDDRNDKQRLKHATPPGPMFFEPPEVQVAEHEDRCCDRDIKPVGVSPPHLSDPQQRVGGWLTLISQSRYPAEDARSLRYFARSHAFESVPANPYPLLTSSLANATRKEGPFLCCNILRHNERSGTTIAESPFADHTIRCLWMWAPPGSAYPTSSCLDQDQPAESGPSRAQLPKAGRSASLLIG